MKEPVVGGLLADITNFIKTISDVIFKGIDTLMKWGCEISKGEKTEDGGMILYIKTPNGNEFQAEVTPVQGKAGVFDMMFDDGKGKEMPFKNVREKDFVSKAQVVAKEWFQEELGKGNVEDNKGKQYASTGIHVTLKRVVSDTEASIEMVAVNGSCDPTIILSTIEHVCDSDDFVAQISEEPSSYSIIDEGECFDIQPIDEVCTDDTYCHILQSAIRLLHNLQYVHWNAVGEEFLALHSLTNEYLWRIQGQVDEIAEWCVEKCGHAPHVGTLSDSTLASELPAQFKLREGIDVIRTSIQMYVATMETYYCNMEPDIQGKVDEFVRGWKSESEYKLTQMLKA